MNERIEFDQNDWRRWDRLVPDQPVGGCWLWQGALNKKGYGAFRVDEVVLLAHRVAYEVARGVIPPGAQIRHLCPGNDHHRNCVNPSHLEIGTAKENGEDKSKLWAGRGHYSGEKNGNAKLTADQVMQIRSAFASGEPRDQIAERFEITQRSVFNIGSGITWTETPKKQKKPDKIYPTDYELVLTEEDKAKLWANTIDQADGCKTWVGGHDAEGYGYLRIQGKVRSAHRMALLAGGIALQRGMDVAHTCAIATCVNPLHLKLETRSDNMKNRKTRERLSANCASRGNQRLTDDQVRRIKETYRDEPALTDQEIVDRFSLPVGPAALAKIRKGQSGVHVHVEGFEPSVRHGSAARGRRNSRSKLSEEQVLEIRRRGTAGEPSPALAGEFKVSRRNVDDIVAGRTWTHLGEELPSGLVSTS